jgi:hypothetical protein
MNILIDIFFRRLSRIDARSLVEDIVKDGKLRYETFF